MKKDRNIIKGNKFHVPTSKKDKTFYAVIQIKSTKKQLKDALSKDAKEQGTPKFDEVVKTAKGSRIVAFNELTDLARKLGGRITYFNAFSN